MARADAVLSRGAPDPELVIPATKLHAPSTRPGTVPRTGLLPALVAGTAKMTLVDAPAGFGKTTLIAEWRESPAEPRPFAWLSLDEADNDPTRFWACIIAALRTLWPELGAACEAVLANAGAALEDVALPLLINDLSALPEPAVLVLDDYHAVREERVHDSLRFFVDRMPPTLHLVVATRSDPPLPLARLRARGEMAEIRAAQLRFSDAEAAVLLRTALDVELEPADVASLQQRTEGWPAGLYLAALSLRDRTDTREFIASFAGDDRHVVDYLVAEVLAGQPDELRAFLLRTSILERFCAPLCDAVTGGTDAPATLERIEQRNLFLVPLDNTRQWYRYHHLFGDLLRQELKRTAPGEVRELHRRAYEWFRSRGAVTEAVHHAAAAGRSEDVRELVAGNWNRVFNQGRLETVGRWLDLLAPDVVAADPRLCVARAWLALDAGRLDAACGWIDAAASGGVEQDAAVLRAVHQFKTGNLAAAASAARQVLDLPTDDAFALTVAHLVLGASMHWRGDPAAAAAALEAGAQLAEDAGNDLGRSYALGYVALAAADAGDLDAAERLAANALGLRDDAGFNEHFVASIGHLALGTVALRRGRLESADAVLRRAFELSARGAGRLEVAAAALQRAEVLHSLGDGPEARRLIAETELLLRDCVDAGALAQRLAAARRALGEDAAANGDELTDRELSVLRLLAGDLSQREIGAALYVSLNTVKTHTRGIYRKLGASTRAEAVARARAQDLI
jgi:LuxR family transcriptional regulator, maltose regulon positive regulatory protein